MATARQGHQAVVYVYTSVTGDTAGAALRLQEQAARRWAQEQGYTVDRVVADVADRSQLRAALEDVQRHRVHAIAIPSTEILGGTFGAAVLLALNNVGGVLLSAREKMTATGLFNR